MRHERVRVALDDDGLPVASIASGADLRDPLLRRKLERFALLVRCVVVRHNRHGGLFAGLTRYSPWSFHLAYWPGNALGKPIAVGGSLGRNEATARGAVFTLQQWSKATGIPLAKVAARVMIGRTLAQMGLTEDLGVDGFFVKSPVFPFVRFPGVDTILGPEMKSTGEVMGIDRDFPTAYIKSQLGEGTRLPSSGVLFVSVKDSDKPIILPPVRALIELGFRVIATAGTATYLSGEGLAVERVNKVAQGRPHIVDKIKDGEVGLIFNTTEGWQSHKDSASIRASAVMQKIPYFTTAASSAAVVRAIASLRDHSLEVRSLQDYYSASRA